MHTLEQLSELTKTLLRGDKNAQIYSVSSLKEASHGQISFVSNAKYKKHLESTEASAVIISKESAKEYKGNALISRNPYLTFAHVINILYAESKPDANVHASTSVHKNSRLHKSVNIGPNVVIEEGVEIGADVVIDAGCYIGRNSKLLSGTHLYPNVTVYKGTKIGENTIIHSGVIIGADGFGFAPTTEKAWFKIKQIGNVIIGDDVEIGANSTIDRAALTSTIIKNGVKLDNQIQVAHNVIIDEHTAIAAGTVIGGSTTIGKHCQIGGAVAIAGHINIADDVIITGRCMVINSIKTSGIYSSGITADENKKWRKNATRFKKLDEMTKKVRALEKKLKEK